MRKKVLIRFDDICPTMNRIQWDRAKTILDKYSIKPLLGVVPDNIDDQLICDTENDNFWEEIRELSSNGYKIAMHGYQHNYDIKAKGIINNKKISEFAGHPYNVQLLKIKKGKEIFEKHNIYVDTFFAPSHSYDRNTLLALKACGFKYVSDGKTNKIIKRNGILCVPSSFTSNPIIKSKYATVVFHTNEWSIPEKAYGFNNLEKLCQNNEYDFLSFYDFVNRRCGIAFFQLIIEKFKLFYEYTIFPFFRKIYHTIFKRKHI